MNGEKNGGLFGTVKVMWHGGLIVAVFAGGVTFANLQSWQKDHAEKDAHSQARRWIDDLRGEQRILSHVVKRHEREINALLKRIREMEANRSSLNGDGL